jgi:hypothetical protein
MMRSVMPNRDVAQSIRTHSTNPVTYCLSLTALVSPNLCPLSARLTAVYMAPVPPEDLRRLEMMFRFRNTLDNSPGVFHPFTDISQRPIAAAAPSSSEFTGMHSLRPQKFLLDHRLALDCGASASVFTVQVCEDDFGSVLRVVGAGPESQCSGFSGQQSDYFSRRPQGLPRRCCQLAPAFDIPSYQPQHV